MKRPRTFRFSEVPRRAEGYPPEDALQIRAVRPSTLRRRPGRPAKTTHPRYAAMLRRIKRWMKWGISTEEIAQKLGIPEQLITDWIYDTPRE